MPDPSVLDIARSYLAAGLGVLPIRADGSKAPALSRGHPYLRTRPEDRDLVAWFGVGCPPGIAIPCGAVSGNLETLDFEAEALYRQWRGLVEAQVPGLVSRLAWSWTPGHHDGTRGLHARYRVEGMPVPGNTALAYLPQLATSGRTLPAGQAVDGRGRPLWDVAIETRGEGGYAVAPGSPPACHRSGRSWQYAFGPEIPQLPTIAAGEREVLVSCARALDQHVEYKAPAERPGEQFEREASWENILCPHGWRKDHVAADGLTHWIRPGKDHGTSATTGPRPLAGGADLLKVFTSSSPFQPRVCCCKFTAYALLEHAGDFKAAARALAEQQRRPRTTPQAPLPPPASAGKPPEPPPEPVLVQLSTVVPERVPWLWDLWLPLGSLVVLDGDPGLGKSTLTLDLAARLSRGMALPPLEGRDLGRGPVGVVLLGAEDVLRYTVRPRLDAAGADSERVWSFEAVKSGDSDRPPTLPYDLELLEAFIKDRDVKLVVVDPLMAFIGSEFESHKDQDIRRCLRPMARLADRLGISILVLRHLNKLAGGPALYRGGSSIGITGAARASLIVGRDPETEGRYVLAMNKPNLGPWPTSLAYRIEASGFSSKIVWEGEVDLRADQILGHAARGAGRPAGEVAAASAWLADLLSLGAVGASEIQESAELAGHSWRTVRRAKDSIGATAFRRGKEWFWELAESKVAKNKALGELAIFGSGQLEDGQSGESPG